AGGRNNNHRKKTTTDTSTCSALGPDGILNDATPCVDAAMKDVSLSVEANATTGNAPGKPSYATATGKTNSIRVVSERFANTAYGFFLGKKVPYPIIANYVRNTWGKYGLARSMFILSTGSFSFQFSSMDGLDAMLENGPWFIRNKPIILKKWHPNENLLKEDVCTVPVWVKLHGILVTAFSEDGLSAIATKLGVGEKKTVMKPSQTPQGILVGPKIGFKPHKEYRPILKNLTASSSGNKKKGVQPIIEVSKLRLLDNDRNPLVPTGIVKSDSEVEVVFDETANLRISTSGKDGSDKGYGTNSLLEQWRDSYPDNDDYDPYDDDMYENHDLSEHLQSICDDLDITVRGRKKK
ncbi:zinc finger, CCHC-type containing protein, partial [Tanacetum coccineum]